MTINNEHCIEVCNSLLRGELSAVETYDQALEKLGKHAEGSELKRLRLEHKDNVDVLVKNIRLMGGVPEKDAGIWGTFAKAVEGGAKIFGETAALQALKQGEEHGLEQYEDALSDKDVLPDCQRMFSNDFIPRQKQHISVLESMMQGLQ